MSDQSLTPEMRREILAQCYESGNALPLYMGAYRAEHPGCGTTACITGSAIFLFDKEPWDEYDIYQPDYTLNRWRGTVALKAAKLLGLRVPYEHVKEDPDHLFYQFDIETPAQAAAALRALNVKTKA
ncbi:unnamed protein product [Sphagnum balticum]